MQGNAREQSSTSLWRRFLRWLDGQNEPKDPISLHVPKTGDTDILLSATQRKKLEEAVSEPAERKSDLGVFSGDTRFWSRGSGGGGTGSKDGIII